MFQTISREIIKPESGNPIENAWKTVGLQWESDV